MLKMMAVADDRHFSYDNEIEAMNWSSSITSLQFDQLAWLNLYFLGYLSKTKIFKVLANISFL
jgi:hypothetical protein